MKSWKALKLFVQSATTRLALSYLAIIMLMSIGFSVVFYNTSAHELGRPIPQESSDNSGRGSNSGHSSDDHPRYVYDPQFEAFLQQRADEGRRALLIRLTYLNVLALLGGSALSYYLARRTLKPIEENMESQAQFVSDASHELRTPLTALQTTNEVALRKPKLSAIDTKDLLLHNVAEVAKLQALTNGLLRLARPDSNHIVRSSISLQAVASDAMNALIAAAQAKQIVVEDSVPDIKVLGDTQALGQVVVILLDNAIKYSPEGSTIKLGGAQHGKFGVLTIQDEGQGIAAKDLPHIFDRFYRADQSRDKQKVDGYGIGLALAKKITEQLGGEITATSIEDKGSNFAVKLALAA
jgi:two-component system sensor histidine kinase CiaH